jgi:hypothetical protein
MSETDKKSIEFSLRVNAQEAKFLEDTLKRLTKEASTLADAFARLNTGGIGTGSLSSGGVPTPGALNQALAMNRGGTGGRYSLPIVAHVKDMSKELKDATPALKNFALEYTILMDTLNQPLPAGAASVLGAVRGLSSVTGASRTSFGAPAAAPATVPVAGGAAPPSGGGGAIVGGAAPSSGGGGGGGGAIPVPVSPSGTVEKDVFRMAQFQQRLGIVSQIGAEFAKVADFDRHVNAQMLENELAMTQIDRSLTQDRLRGDLTRRMAIRDMGGMKRVQELYGSTRGDKTTDYFGVGAGLGMIGAGAFIAATGGLGLIPAALALGGVGATAYSASDLVTGGPEARATSRMLEAITQRAEIDPLNPFIKDFGAGAIQNVQTSRALNRMFNVRGGGGATAFMQSPQMLLRGYSEASGLPLEMGQNLALSMGRMTNISTRRGAENLFQMLDLAESGYSPEELTGSMATLLNRGVGTSSSLLGGAQAYLGSAEFMAPSLLSATGQLSRTRFGAGGNIGAGTTMAMLAAGGGATTPERLSISASAFQQMQGGATDTFPYMIKLQQINQSFPQLSNTKKMLLAQMGQVDLANKGKIMQVLGVDEQTAKDIQKVVAPIETNLKFGFLSRTEGVGKKIAEEYGGDIYRFLKEGKPTEQEYTEIAGSRMAFAGGSMDETKQELRMRPIAEKGLGGTPRKFTGDAPTEGEARDQLKERFLGESQAFNRVASEIASALSDAAMSIRGILSKGGAATGKVTTPTSTAAGKAGL